MTHRLHYIDNLKGVLILLVVLGTLHPVYRPGLRP